VPLLQVYQCLGVIRNENIAYMFYYHLIHTKNVVKVLVSHSIGGGRCGQGGRVGGGGWSSVL